MTRMRSTARVTSEGEETEVTETAPISEVMKQSGLVVIVGNTDEGTVVAEAEQTIV
jgi:phosphotransferase system IIB component